MNEREENSELNGWRGGGGRRKEMKKKSLVYK
jgi:hypothetical protein